MSAPSDQSGRENLKTAAQGATGGQDLSEDQRGAMVAIIESERKEPKPKKQQPSSNPDANQSNPNSNRSNTNANQNDFNVDDEEDDASYETESDEGYSLTDALVNLLNHMDLEEFEDPYLLAMGQPDYYTNPRRTAPRPSQIRPYEIDAITFTAIKKIKSMELCTGAMEHLEDAFLILIRDEESEKSKFNLIIGYNEECGSSLEVFFKKREYMKELFTNVWSNYLLEMVTLTSQRYLNDHDGAKRSLARLCEAVSKKLLERSKGDIYRELVPRARSALKVGVKFTLSEVCIHAVFAFLTAAELYKRQNKGNKSADDVRECVNNVFLVSGQLISDQQLIVTEHVIPIMRKMLLCIYSIHSATRVEGVIQVAWCATYVGWCYILLEKYQLALREFEAAVDLLQTEFLSTASKYRIYGGSLYLIGTTFYIIGNIPRANEVFKLSFEAYKNVEDWESDEMRDTFLREVRLQLERMLLIQVRLQQIRTDYEL